MSLHLFCLEKYDWVGMGWRHHLMFPTNEPVRYLYAAAVRNKTAVEFFTGLERSFHAVG